MRTKQEQKRMTTMEKEPYFRQFPWLEEYTKGIDYVSCIHVERADYELLDRVSGTRHDYNLGTRFTEKLLILDQDGNMLVRVGLQIIHPDTTKQWWQFWKSKHPFERILQSETVSDALDKLLEKERSRAYFIFLLKFRSRSVTIFKPKGNQPLVEWIEKERIGLQHKLARALVEIDNG